MTTETVQRQQEVTYLEAISQALDEEMARDERVFLMGEDIGTYGGAFRITEGFMAKYGEWRVIDTPLAESGFVGAAIGAAMTPPAISVSTQYQFTCSQPSEMTNPSVADKATANSDVSTVPTTLRASMFLLANSTGVAIGPQPPPPVASRKPAAKPSGTSCLLDHCFPDADGARPFNTKNR